MRTSDHMYEVLGQLHKQMDEYKGEMLNDSIYNVLGLKDGKPPHREAFELLQSIHGTAVKLNLISDVSLAEFGDMDGTSSVMDALKFMINDLQPLCTQNTVRDFQTVPIPEEISANLRSSGRLNLKLAQF